MVGEEKGVPTVPRAHGPTGPRAPRAHGPTGPRAPRAHGPTGHGLTGPRAHGPTGPRSHGPAGPRAQAHGPMTSDIQEDFFASQLVI